MTSTQANASLLRRRMTDDMRMRQLAPKSKRLRRAVLAYR
jgi:hypothetical protein